MIVGLGFTIYIYLGPIFTVSLWSEEVVKIVLVFIGSENYVYRQFIMKTGGENVSLQVVINRTGCENHYVKNGL